MADETGAPLSVRADVDRYRVRLPEGREQVDTFMLGGQYTFR